VRALYALAAQDAEIRNTLRERRDSNAQRLAAWLAALAERGIVTLRDAESTGAVLFSMLDGIGREAVAAGEPLEEHRLAAAVDLVERAVFGTPA
jgi:DNA-binding transcriptional regulator YbjK